ncbi:PaaI family thioesterase [Parvularcula sp. IMCC14364]|uniref:PaaI family thioesterase n=1 Tax=Parvularcula sp. IMCC14364 TaxID=3067902 RepID=UPI0027422BA1|nr:PaaI family thioesterase [Parvularcula sp. IMCC14364]
MSYSLFENLPITQETVEEAYDFVFAPWVKDLGLRDFLVKPGFASAQLPIADKLKFSSGAVCGQAIMAAIDTVTAISMWTSDRMIKGTAYQHTHFLRPAVNDDFLVEATVKRFGKSSAYAECDVKYLTSGKLVAHGVLEFAF